MICEALRKAHNADGVNVIQIFEFTRTGQLVIEILCRRCGCKHSVDASCPEEAWLSEYIASRLNDVPRIVVPGE